MGNRPDFDFALIKMKTTIDFSAYTHIRPVCLPTNPDNTYENYEATLAGWGTHKYEETENENELLPHLSNKLLEVDLSVISNEDCGSKITDQMLCTFSPGKDACAGDSGGPLVTSGAGNGLVPGQNYEVIGVVSYGIPCYLDVPHPGVFGRVTAQLDWIREVTSETWSSCPRNKSHQASPS